MFRILNPEISEMWDFFFFISLDFHPNKVWNVCLQERSKLQSLCEMCREQLTTIVDIGILVFDEPWTRLSSFQGFGAGNFKSLFEAIEKDQDARGNLKVLTPQGQAKAFHWPSAHCWTSRRSLCTAAYQMQSADPCKAIFHTVHVTGCATSNAPSCVLILCCLAK